MLRTAESVKTHGVIRTSALSAKLLFGRRMRPGESLAGMTRHRGNGAAPTNGMCPTRTVRNKRNRHNSGKPAEKVGAGCHANNVLWWLLRAEVCGNGILEPEETPMEKCLDMALVTCGDMGAKSVLEAFGAFGGFHSWQAAGLNASKKRLMWPGRRRNAIDMALVPGRAGTWVPKVFWKLLKRLQGFTAGKRQA